MYRKLLGPCFKTGRMSDRLYDEQSAEAQNNNPTPKQAQNARVLHKSNAGLPPEPTSPTLKCYNRTALIRHPLHKVSAETVLLNNFHRQHQSTRRTLYANALPYATTNSTRSPKRQINAKQSQRTTTEYALDTSTSFVSIISISRSLALSFQSAFQLSLTVLVRYWSRGHI